MSESTHAVRVLTFIVEVQIHDAQGFTLADELALALTAAAVEAGASSAAISDVELQVRA